MKSTVVKRVILRNELGHKISEIHYQNSENYENIELTRLNNLSKVAFIW
jgi:hypothetical protein